MIPPAGGGGGGGQAQSPAASTEPPFYRWYHKFQALREATESVSWEAILMQSWASSTLDVYERHLKNLRARHLQSPSESPILVLRGSTSWHCIGPNRPHQTCGRQYWPADSWRKPKSPMGLSLGPSGGLFARKIRSHTWQRVAGAPSQRWRPWRQTPSPMKSSWSRPWLSSRLPAATALGRLHPYGSRMSTSHVDRFRSSTEKRGCVGSKGPSARTSEGSWDSLGPLPSGWAEDRPKTWSKGGLRLSSPPWYAFWPTRSIPTSDGMHGGAWGQPCSSSMALPCKSLCPGAAGNLSSSHAATSPPGMTIPGRIPRCPVQPCRESRLELGDLRVGHVHQDPSGQPPFCRGMTRGSPMDPMSRTQTHLRRQFQRSCPSPPSPPQDPLCSPNDPGLPMLPSLEIQGRGPEVERGGVPQWSRSGPRLSPPSNGLRDPGSQSDNRSVSLPPSGVRWRTGLSPLRPKPDRPPQGGGGVLP